MAASMKNKICSSRLTFSVFSTIKRNARSSALHLREKQSLATEGASTQSTDGPASPDTESADWVCAPDKVSNIRKTRYHVPADETSLQRELRQRREETQEWHHQFWTRHNKSFVQLKDEFTKQRKAEKQKEGGSEEDVVITPEEMSEFYTKFLDENYTLHKTYNKEWYGKNLKLLWLALRVNVERLSTFRPSGK